MTKKVIFRSVLFLIFLSSFALSGYSQIAFRLVKGKLAVATVSINKNAHVDLLLDTGSTSTIISPELARQLRIQPTFQTEMITPAGVRFVPGGYLDSVSLGSHSAGKIEVLVTDVKALQQLDENISGVLGENFLAQFDCLFDFDKRRITVDDRGELEVRVRGKRVFIEKDNEHRLLIVVPTKRSNVRFALDSGTTELILFSESASALGFDQSELPPSALSTIGGDSPARLVRLNNLHVGDEILYNLRAVVASRDPNRAEDGLMPLSLFRRVYLNHKKGFVVFNPEF